MAGDVRLRRAPGTGVMVEAEATTGAEEKARRDRGTARRETKALDELERVESIVSGCVSGMKGLWRWDSAEERWKVRES